MCIEKVSAVRKTWNISIFSGLEALVCAGSNYKPKLHHEVNELSYAGQE